MEGPRKVTAEWVCESCNGVKTSDDSGTIPTNWSVAAVGIPGRVGVKAFDEVERHLICEKCASKVTALIMGHGEVTVALNRKS